jgi:hypothetical protein
MDAPDRPVADHRHSCGATWSGSKVSHCGSCHQTFSSLSSFDRHQSRTGTDKLCRDPQEAGLVPVEKPWGVMWSMPGPPAGHWAANARAEAAAS